ncbi:Gfo/Idh/MocA family protein [Alienimonas californiensis]|uniref:Glucose--fructose oxidoreductase n=1 Tax=Alienimonas californiensis TaxID=2527989 RepID=A0A517P405_9PLAN|nr:Gfo/Idh/MocA family oxidoreductase [Alienimonas californiensis]QDT14117.1 Glucose--fructose oxidoreductase precursor [Alienimonas californiensis]
MPASGSIVRWGILGAARIAVNKVIPATQRAANAEVVAIASRRRDAAERAAADLGISRVHDSYEALLADENVDAVYIPLPNDAHVPWSLKALAAGKHVLCEKPLALSSVEAQTLVDAAAAHPELKVMEAFMYRLHPQWVRFKELIDGGAIGELKSIQSFFSYFNRNADDIRNDPAKGGGALMDIGCYQISLSRWLFDAEPDRVLGRIEIDPDYGTDRIADGVLDFGRGTSTFTCSTQLVPYQRVNAFGTAGRVELEIPFNAPPNAPCVLHLQSGRAGEYGAPVREDLPVADQYTLQAEAFGDAVLNDTPVPTPLTDAVANLRVIEALRASDERGAWETL